MISLMQYRASVGLYNILGQRIFALGEGAVLVDFAVYVLSRGDIPACITETSTFMENELLRWGLVHSNGAYRFYFLLLIRLANDVETNPGPPFFMESSETIKSNHVSSEIKRAMVRPWCC